MVQSIPTVGGGGRGGQINNLAPNSNHTDKLFKTGHVLHSLRNQKKRGKQSNPPTCVLEWKYKNANYFNTVLLQNFLAETKAMPVQ